MSAIKPEGASHWYDMMGTPVHEVLRADGSAMRPTTLADARKLRLLPSVTNITSVVREPYLEAWRAEQYMDATLEALFNWASKYMASIGEAATHPTNRDEIKQQAVELAERKMAEPRDLGSAYHETISNLVQLIDFDGEFVALPDGVNWRTVHAFCEFYEAHCKTTIHPETSFACALGYGGTIDWRGEFTEDHSALSQFAVIDWKTTRTVEGKRIAFREKWARQLAAYAYGIDKPHALLVNVVISTTEPGRIEWYAWPEGAEYWFERFARVFAVWRDEKDFDPREG